MRERVRAIAVVSGAPPLADLMDRGGLLPLYRWLLFFYPRHRELLRFSFHAVRPFLSLKVPVRFGRFCSNCSSPAMPMSCGISPPSRLALKVSARPGVLPPMVLMVDAEIYAQPWGFPLEDIRVPVRLWHGKKDRSFHWQLASR